MVGLSVLNRLNRVLFTHNHFDGLVLFDHFFIDVTKTGNDNDIADLHMMSGCPIDANNARTRLGWRHDISHETVAIGHIPNVYLFVLKKLRSIENVFIDSDGAFVINIRVGNRGAVNFGF